MFTVTVRDHMMIAHSFQGEVFGPAQRLHGATYVIDVEFQAPAMDRHGIVVDIGLAATNLKSVIEALNFRNLDDETAFKGINTTTEFLAKLIFDRMAERIAAGELGEQARAVTGLKVTLGESHVAWASFAAPLTIG